MAVSKGVYSLYNGWLQKPEKSEIPEMPDISSEYKDYEAKAKACDTVEAIDNFMDDIYKLRQNSLLTDGEFGKGNLIFKELRNNNVLQDLKDKKTELENKEMSLGESINDTYKILISKSDKLSNDEIIKKDIELINKYPKFLTDAKNSKESLIKGLEDNTIEPYELYDYMVQTLLEKGVNFNIDESLNESFERKVAEQELEADFDDLEIEEFSSDDDFIIMYLINRETDEGFKVVVRDPDYDDENNLSYQIFEAISETLAELEMQGIDMKLGDRFDEDFIEWDIYDQLSPEEQQYIDDHNLSIQEVDGIIFLSDAYEEYEYKNVAELKAELQYDIEQEAEFDRNFSLEESTIEDKKAKALADFLDISVEAVDQDDSDDDFYSTPEGDYLVYTDAEANEATANAIAEIIGDAGIDAAFTDDFKDFILGNCINWESIDAFIAEEIDYYETQEDDPAMGEKLRDMSQDEALDYIIGQMGSEDFYKWAVTNGALDMDKLVDEAITQDGRGHFLSMLDGREIELDNNLFAYWVG